MRCNHVGPCPYDSQCNGCLHHVYERPKKYRKTGIPRDDLMAYKREYARRERQRALELEMICAGVMEVRNGR